MNRLCEEKWDVGEDWWIIQFLGFAYLGLGLGWRAGQGLGFFLSLKPNKFPNLRDLCLVWSFVITCKLWMLIIYIRETLPNMHSNVSLHLCNKTTSQASSIWFWIVVSNDKSVRSILLWNRSHIVQRVMSLSIWKIMLRLRIDLRFEIIFSQHFSSMFKWTN